MISILSSGFLAGLSHLDLSEILERIFKRLKINDVFLCSCSLHFVYLYLISSDLTNTLAAMIYGKYLSNPFVSPLPRQEKQLLRAYGQPVRLQK